jgi:hypothetical protein
MANQCPSEHPSSGIRCQRNEGHTGWHMKDIKEKIGSMDRPHTVTWGTPEQPSDFNPIQ